LPEPKTDTTAQLEKSSSSPCAASVMAPIQFPLILYSIIGINVFLVIILFGCIYMNLSNSAGLFQDIDFFFDCILITPWAPGTCAVVLGCFCYIYTNNCWMTPDLFFILTYPTYDPTVNFPFNFLNSVNFPFNFLNFHSDALLCHLLFLPITLMHLIALCFFCSPIIKRRHLPWHHASRIKDSS
jgi:hypothetical protein